MAACQNMPKSCQHGMKKSYLLEQWSADEIHGKMAMYFFILLPFYKV